MDIIIYSRGETQRWENSCVGHTARLLVCGIIVGNGEKIVMMLHPLQALVRKLLRMVDCHGTLVVGLFFVRLKCCPHSERIF